MLETTFQYLCPTMEQPIIIAVDGYSSCGKSTLAKDLAKALGYIYIDSGAMYRAVTLYLLQNGYNYQDIDDVKEALTEIDISFKADEETGENLTHLNGREVEDLIRSKAVADIVSEVSTIKEVREFLVEQQRKVGRDKGVVMDGRDIGTVVFKDAELKIFLTADIHTRVERRYAETLAKGLDMSRAEIADNLQHRDYVDTHREESPLYKADDSILLDNTILSRERQLNLVLNMAKKIIAGEQVG